MKYIDVHGHVYFPDYDSDREAAISRASAADVGIITVGTDLDSSRAAIELAEQHENMWAITGLHPVDAGEAAGNTAGHTADNVGFDYDAFKKLAQHPKVVAIGECGLDYFHMPLVADGTAEVAQAEIKKRIDAQREIFIQHIRLANEVKKPLMLHVRNAKNAGQGNVVGQNAYQDALAILKEHAKVRANFHFFAGTLADLKNIIDAGLSVSFTGVITFVKEYESLVKAVPLGQIMSETDAPFVSPAPYRGKRNEPVYVIEVAKKIAEIRGEDEETVLKALVSNAKKFFFV